MFRTSRLRRAATGTIAAVALVGTTLAASAAPQPPTPTPTPTIRGEGSASAIPDSYLVKLKDTASVRSQGIDGRARALNDAHRGKLGQVWTHVLHGFATTMTRDEALQLAAEPDVEYVIQDQLVAGGGLSPAQPSPGVTQSSAPWGLDRIDQHALPLDGKYSYDESAGEGVDAYIVSAGIAAAHPDFGGRASGGGNFVLDGKPSSTDCHGAGTWQAGIVGGTQNGVAKKANLIGVRISNCNNQFLVSAAVSGFDWIVGNADLPAIVLFALGPLCVDPQTGEGVPCDPGIAAALVQIQEDAFGAGLPVIGSAGDIAHDTCANSSGAAPHTIYVGATTSTDARLSTSNFGPCVTMYAPGEGTITNSPTGGTFVLSDTVASAAHVAGTAALFAGKPEFEGASPAQIRAELVTNRSTPNVISGLSSNTPNLLLFTGPPGLFTIGDSASVTLRSDGRLELFGVNKDGQMFHRPQSSAGGSTWADWTASSTKGWLSVGSESNADGRLALLGLTPSGEIWLREETAANSNAWYNWTRLSGTTSGVPIARAVMAHNQSNRLQIFATDHQGKAYYRSQLSPGSKLWSFWTGLNFPGKVRDITAVPHADGRIEVLATNDAGEIWRTSQTNPTDTNWGPFTKLNGFGMASITATRHANGNLELVGLDTGGGPWRRTRNTSGTWGDWIALTPMAAALSQVTAETNADGRIQIVAVDNLGRIWQKTQTSANASTYTSWLNVLGTLRP